MKSHKNIRRQFPFLKERIKGHSLTYFDSAATTQKPECVLQTMDEFQRTSMANVHRALHPLAERATNAYEAARTTVQKFINAPKRHEVIFTKGTTESINLLARSFGSTLQKGDAIALTHMEHHSNIIPWLQLKEEHGINIHWLKIDNDGALDKKNLKNVLSKKGVKALSITGMSNVLGTMPDLLAITKIAHKHGVAVFVDAAQLIAHHPIDVQRLGIDALVFSGHKIYGPTGIGVVWAREEFLEKLPPFLGGGEMIQTVTEEEFTCAELPRKFEAGTPPITEAIGLSAALKWINGIGWESIKEHEKNLMEYALPELLKIEGLKILGPETSEKRSGCISFTITGIHPHDITHIVGEQGICLRGGHHCTQPLHRALGINASVRLSFGIYNTIEEIDRAIKSIRSVVKKFR